MFPHQNIHKYTWTSVDGNTHNHTDHILRERRWHSSILNIVSFRGADCDTDHYLVVAKVRERLAVSKQAAQKCDGERFNMKKLNKLEVRKQYKTEITNRFAALENLVMVRTQTGHGKELQRLSKPQMKVSTFSLSMVSPRNW
jgi:hypothetical protein